MTVHTHSLASFHALDGTARKLAVLGAYAGGAWLTDRQVAEVLGCTDMNAVRPRITELVQEGALAEVGSARCEVTRRKVRICAAAP